jgi:hypothetical protein
MKSGRRCRDSVRGQVADLALLHGVKLPDPFPPQIEELARTYFELYSPEVKA